MPIDAIIFDKDGTLFDFANTWGGFGRSMLLRLSDGDEDRATELGRVIGYDFEQGRYTEDSIVIAATVEEIAEVLIAHVDGVTLQGDHRFDELRGRLGPAGARRSIGSFSGRSAKRRHQAGRCDE